MERSDPTARRTGAEPPSGASRRGGRGTDGGVAWHALPNRRVPDRRAASPGGSHRAGWHAARWRSPAGGDAAAARLVAPLAGRHRRRLRCPGGGDGRAPPLHGRGPAASRSRRRLLDQRRRTDLHLRAAPGRPLPQRRAIFRRGLRRCLGALPGSRVRRAQHARVAEGGERRSSRRGDARGHHHRAVRPLPLDRRHDLSLPESRPG